MYRRIFAALVGCSFAALGAPIGEFSTTTTTSVSSQTVNNPLSVTQSLFSTQIIARGAGGQVAFDQTSSFAFADPVVQGLVAQATLALNGLGSTSILGPNLISSQVDFEGSSIAASLTGSRRDTYEIDGRIGGLLTFGPAVLTVGSLDCQSFAITNATPRTDVDSGFEFAGVGLPGGCTGGTQLVLGLNDSNIDVWWHILTTNFQDVVTTDTYRTRQVYLLQAQEGGTAAEVPEPGTIGMLLAAAPVFFALRRRR